MRLLLFLFFFVPIWALALGIQEIGCAGDEYLLVTGVSSGISCTVTDKAGGKKTAEAQTFGGAYKLDLNTDRFLNNSNESFTLVCGSESLEVSYGSSCSSWVIDGASSTDDTDSSDTDDTSEQKADENTSREKRSDPFWQLELSAPQSAPVNTLIVLDPRTYFVSSLGKKRERASGIIIWHWGDGQQNQKKVGRIGHIYHAPGKYHLLVEFFNGELDLQDGKPTIAREYLIEVFQPQIRVSRDGLGNIILQNKSTKKLDLMGWRIVSGTQNFTIRGKAIVSAGESWTLAKSVSGFSSSISSIQVFDQYNNKIASKYSTKKKPRTKTKSPAQNSESEKEIMVSSDDAPLTDADKISSDTVDMPSRDSGGSSIPLLAAFMMIGSAIFLALRNPLEQPKKEEVLDDD